MAESILEDIYDNAIAAVVRSESEEAKASDVVATTTIDNVVSEAVTEASPATNLDGVSSSDNALNSPEAQ